MYITIPRQLNACLLCLHEKWANITNPYKNEILNKRPEFFCRYHKQKESHCQIHCCWFLWEIKTLISFKMLFKKNKIKNKKQSRIQLITYFGVFTYYTYVSVYSCVNVCIFKCSCTCVCFEYVSYKIDDFVVIFNKYYDLHIRIECY